MKKIRKIRIVDLWCREEWKSDLKSLLRLLSSFVVSLDISIIFSMNLTLAIETFHCSLITNIILLSKRVLSFRFVQKRTLMSYACATHAAGESRYRFSGVCPSVCVCVFVCLSRDLSRFSDQEGMVAVLGEGNRANRF